MGGDVSLTLVFIGKIPSKGVGINTIKEDVLDVLMSVVIEVAIRIDIDASVG